MKQSTTFDPERFNAAVERVQAIEAKVKATAFSPDGLKESVRKDVSDAISNPENYEGYLSAKEEIKTLLATLDALSPAARALVIERCTTLSGKAPESKDSEKTEKSSEKLEKEILSNLDSSYKERVKGWMKIKEDQVDETEYLQALERWNTVLENKEQRRKELGTPLTAKESKLTGKESGVVIKNNSLWMTGEAKDKWLKNNSKSLEKEQKEFTPEKDILRLLNALSGTAYTTLDEAIGENPIDRALVAPVLGLSGENGEWDNNHFLGVSSAGGRVVALFIDRDDVRLFKRNCLNNYFERLVRVKNS
ncbi:MAG: hypothetical protein LBO09_04615 [Candidatus Peribacteria bacterium]|jgi:hypothetical protein|nr:hypothetical protein [Candidatus Peribacteria bacterium]